MSKKLITDVEQLIEIVKEYPAVYSKAGLVSGAVNNNEKSVIWAEIAKRLNENDPNKLKQKWRNLRDTYQKAVKYKRDLEEIGQLAKYHPYRHEHRMSFLLPHILVDTPPRKKRIQSYNKNDDYKIEKIEKKETTLSYTIESQDVEYLVEDVEFTEIKRNDDEDRLETIVYKDQEEIDQQNVDTLETDSNICYEEVESCNELNDAEAPTRSTMDDIDMWLSSVKASIMKLTKINRARAKRDINTILSNYEIEQYEAEDN